MPRISLILSRCLSLTPRKSETSLVVVQSSLKASRTSENEWLAGRAYGVERRWQEAFLA